MTYPCFHMKHQLMIDVKQKGQARYAPCCNFKKSLDIMINNNQDIITVSAEQILFVWAASLSQQAAVEELNSNNRQSMKLYKDSLRVFELLRIDASMNNDKFDQQTLTNTMNQIKKRLIVVSK